MDSRHFSTDGRLGYWAPAQVERALHWIPGKVTAVPEDLLDAPETLRSLLRYLEATGLRDPRGATTAENEAALELGGPEAVTEQLSRFPPGRRKDSHAPSSPPGSRSRRRSRSSAPWSPPRSCTARPSRTRHRIGPGPCPRGIVGI
jgi:hypothetical protein